jgi:hypothetical protein
MYIKNKQGVLLDKTNKFVYEMCVYIKYNNIYSLALHKFFSSDRFLRVQEDIKLNTYVSINTELHAAPLKWLARNNFKPYFNEQKIKTNKRPSK